MPVGGGMPSLPLTNRSRRAGSGVRSQFCTVKMGKCISAGVCLVPTGCSRGFYRLSRAIMAVLAVDLGLVAGCALLAAAVSILTAARQGIWQQH